MSAHNEVTIYSSGIADFRRVFRLAKGESREVALAVKKPHVGDVLASLNVFGDVTLAAPPSFSPENENRSSLTIDPASVLEQLATQACGVRVRLERAAGAPLVGTLMGLHTETEPSAGEPAPVKYLVVSTDDGIARLSTRDCLRLVFEDEGMRAELAKALRRQAESLRPDSTEIRLTLAASAAGDAFVQYTLPAAAWKITYRLRELTDGKFTLLGLAVVDNNTDEDWNDFLIRVVTGEPISFSTDLAEAKVPRRKRVNVVQDEAQGVVEVAEAEATLLEGIMGAVAPASGGGATSLQAKLARVRAPRGDARQAEALMERSLGPSQMKPVADAREVGDYSVYQCRQPVSIGANRSAIIPVFEAEMSDARCVLYYKSDQHPERPFRSVKLIHPGPQSLGRGVCTVFQGGIYGGHCLVPATRPGEERLLPFAVESGVKVVHETPRMEWRTAGVTIQQGVCWQTTLIVRETVYRIRSTREEAYALVIDHPELARPCQARITVERTGRTEPLPASATGPAGYRLEIALQPRDQVIVRSIESRTTRVELKLNDAADIPRLDAMFQTPEKPLLANPVFQQCLRIQEQNAAKRDEIRRVQEQAKALAERQERLRKNLGVAGNDEQTTRWRAELGEVETRITDIEETILPRLAREQRDLETALREALKAIVFDWTANGALDGSEPIADQPGP